MESKNKFHKIRIYVWKNAGRKDIKNPGGAIPNSVIFWTRRAQKRDIRDPNTLRRRARIFSGRHNLKLRPPPKTFSCSVFTLLYHHLKRTKVEDTFFKQKATTNIRRRRRSYSTKIAPTTVLSTHIAFHEELRTIIFPISSTARN
jgi:hypothetical protein